MATTRRSDEIFPLWAEIGGDFHPEDEDDRQAGQWFLQANMERTNQIDPDRLYEFIWYYITEYSRILTSMEHINLHVILTYILVSFKEFRFQNLSRILLKSKRRSTWITWLSKGTCDRASPRHWRRADYVTNRLKTAMVAWIWGAESRSPTYRGLKTLA